MTNMDRKPAGKYHKTPICSLFRWMQTGRWGGGEVKCK